MTWHLYNHNSRENTGGVVYFIIVVVTLYLIVIVHNFTVSRLLIFFGFINYIFGVYTLEFIMNSITVGQGK